MPTRGTLGHDMMFRSCTIQVNFVLSVSICWLTDPYIYWHYSVHDSGLRESRNPCGVGEFRF